jgi:hypothetical protein
MPVIPGGSLVTGPGRVLHQAVLFTETSGAGTYTGSVEIPYGSFLLEVVVHGIALWDNAGTVDMIVGDSQASTGDPDGIFVITSLKSGGDLTAGQSISAAGGTNTASGEVGADIAATAWERRYLAGTRTITGVITTSSTGGSTGRTLMLVVYTDPTSVAAATKS